MDPDKLMQWAAHLAWCNAMLSQADGFSICHRTVGLTGSALIAPEENDMVIKCVTEIKRLCEDRIRRLALGK